MKPNVCIIAACIISVFSNFCILEAGGTVSAPEGTTTLKGNIMCNTAVEGGALSATGWGRDIRQRLIEEHALVFFAITGTKEVDNIVSALLDAYFPAEGMNTDQAQAVIDGLKKDLKFYLKTDAGIEPPREEVNLLKILGNPPPRTARSRGTGHNVLDYGNFIISLTGVIEYIDGKKYFSVSSAEYLNMDYSIYPDRMKVADVPLKPNTGFPDYVLKLNKAGSMTAKTKYIPSGDFLMGSPFYLGTRFQDEFPHKVVLTKSFYMMEIPVTQAMWKEVMGVEKTIAPNALGADPEVFRNKQSFGPNKPVEYVTWNEIQEFCKRLSEINGRTVRLPTDSEWEYSARVGTSNPAFTQKYTEESSRAGSDADVKTMKPNAWGLYDMPSMGWHMVSDYKSDNFRWTSIDPTGIEEPSVRDGDGAWLHKAKGGWHHDINAPHMHGAISESGRLCEHGKPIFRVVVE